MEQGPIAPAGRGDEILYRQAALEEIYRLRFAVLRPGQPVQKVHFPHDDAAPPVTWHFGAFLPAGGQWRTIACLTYLASRHEDRPALQLRGMAVEEAFRGKGVGGRLLDLAEEIVTATAPCVLWCNARVPAVHFYERHGWRCISEEFMINGVGVHRKLVKQVSERV